MTSPELLTFLTKNRRLKVLFLGQCDMGKTTLIADVVKELSAASSVAIVDCDVGQSHIGPPTTIGWGRVADGFRTLSDVNPEGLYFVGSTSPQYHLLPTALGTLRMTARAACTADKVLVDTPGFIHGEAARALLWHIIDSTQPELLVAVQKAGELEHVLAAYRGSGWPFIIRLAPSDACVEKSRAERMGYRESLFGRYFQDSRELQVSWQDIPFRARAAINDETAHDLINRLVSLRNSAGEDIALGIITRVHQTERGFQVFTPLPAGLPIASVVVGSIRLTTDGKEIPWPEGTTVPVP